jgi:hypothetical protein
MKCAACKGAKLLQHAVFLLCCDGRLDQKEAALPQTSFGCQHDLSSNMHGDD